MFLWPSMVTARELFPRRSLNTVTRTCKSPLPGINLSENALSMATMVFVTSTLRYSQKHSRTVAWIISRVKNPCLYNGYDPSTRSKGFPVVYTPSCEAPNPHSFRPAAPP